MLLFRSTLLNTSRLSSRLTSRAVYRPNILRTLATMATDTAKYKLNHSM